MMGIAPAPVLAPVLPSRHTTLEGFLWALVMLGAVRLGRKQAEDNFLDYDGLRVSIMTPVQLHARLHTPLPMQGFHPS